MNVTEVNVNDVIVPAHRVRDKKHDPSSLADSIAQQGLLNPITVRADLTLIAGYHRLAAVKTLGWDRIPANVVALSDVDAELAEIDENLRRHDLSVWEQSKHVARREELMRERGERAPAHRPEKSATVADLPKPKTTPEIAAGAGMSERTWQTRAKVGRSITPEAAQVIDDIDPETCSLPDSTTQLNYLSGITDANDQVDIVTRVADGSARDVWEASKQLKRERAKQEREERKRDNAHLAPTLDTAHDKYDLRHAACIDALKGDPASIDWVITDPPYPREYLETYSDLGRVAAHVLKPGGSLLCMTGQTYLPEVIARLGEHLTYHWILAYLTPGGQAVQQFPRRVNTFWKPVLWFTNGPYDGEWIGDVTKSAVNDNDKEKHHWGQSESGMADLMRRFVQPGDRVLDPFMGAATTGVIALELGAFFAGFDIDEDAFNEAVVRMDNASLP